MLSIKINKYKWIIFSSAMHTYETVTVYDGGTFFQPKWQTDAVSRWCCLLCVFPNSRYHSKDSKLTWQALWLTAIQWNVSDTIVLFYWLKRVLRKIHFWNFTNAACCNIKKIWLRGGLKMWWVFPRPEVILQQWQCKIKVAKLRENLGSKLWNIHTENFFYFAAKDSRQFMWWSE